jgi:hypothetical protein
MMAAVMRWAGEVEALRRYLVMGVLLMAGTDKRPLACQFAGRRGLTFGCGAATDPMATDSTSGVG